eukprot:TRINITY_DN116560_c0_g1_i1.p3 TRINITY_DN116560_c0_g1~~TRINITY_DN116560_c0_g1_i1.p3  ORF type:complete len:133 (-),score=0.86 TRINITY_DN116560_c0_g1_i1:55-405(-)
MSLKLPPLTNTSKKLSNPQDIGEYSEKSCINFGITNFGTMIPPIAARIIFETPPIVVASSVVLAMFAIKSAKEIEAKLTADETKKIKGRLPCITSEPPPSSGTMQIPTSIINTTCT